MTRRLANRLSDDRGSTLLLTIFYSALALTVILIVIAATSLYLERKRLFSVADGAALVGAEAFDLDAPPRPGPVSGPVVTSSEVLTAVNGYVSGQPITDFEGLKVERAVSTDGRSATVELSAYWRPPVFALFVPDGIRIQVTSVARSVFDRLGAGR
jgi:hypothetical protein